MSDKSIQTVIRVQKSKIKAGRAKIGDYPKPPAMNGVAGEIAFLFGLLTTQWDRNDYTGQRIGMKYETIEPTARMNGIEMDSIKFDILRDLENAMMEIEAKDKKND